MKLDNHTKALIAVGASITANCQPCLKSTTAMARASGADEMEIAEAIDVAKRVRNGATSKMDSFAAGLISAVFSEEPAPNVSCGCAEQ